MVYERDQRPLSFNHLRTNDRPSWKAAPTLPSADVVIRHTLRAEQLSAATMMQLPPREGSVNGTSVCSAPEPFVGPLL